MFTEYEQIPKKKANGIFSTAALPENAERSRIREVVPYEENRVELVPTKENNTGYINASHIKVSGGGGGLWKIAGFQAKMQGEKKKNNDRAPTEPLGSSPAPEGVFLNSVQLSQPDGRACPSRWREGSLAASGRTSGRDSPQGNSLVPLRDFQQSPARAREAQGVLFGSRVARGGDFGSRRRCVCPVRDVFRGLGSGRNWSVLPGAGAGRALSRPRPRGVRCPEERTLPCRP